MPEVKMEGGTGLQALLTYTLRARQDRRKIMRGQKCATRRCPSYMVYRGSRALLRSVHATVCTSVQYVK